MLAKPSVVNNEPLGVVIVDADPSPGMILQSYFEKMRIRKSITAERPHQTVGEVIRVHVNTSNELVVDCTIACEFKELTLSRVHDQPETGHEFYVGVIW